VKPKVPVKLEILRPLLSKMVLIMKTRGAAGLISFCKDTRLALLHQLSGEFPLKKVIGVPVYKDGYPKALGPKLVAELRKDTTRVYTRLVFTLLFSTRALSTGVKPDLSTIHRPLSNEASLDIGKYVVDFWKELGYRPSKHWIPRGIYFKEYHMTTKAGPNGHAIWTSMVDLKLLKSSKLLESIKVIGGKKLTARIELLCNWLDQLPGILFPVEGKTLRRITWFPDKESKVRIVAILDYWSQTALKGLHDYLFKVLRKIPQDCTFEQGSFLEKTKSFEYFYSFDLTAATDRFPIVVISKVLKGLLPDHYVEAWVELMVKQPFNLPQSEEVISYNAGNPMGAYSSWNSFTIAHHYVMYWCCRELGIKWSESKYILLGDDVLIGDHKLAKLYLEVMSQLGVDISHSKSHASAKLFEFAKRLILDGAEVTPFPISSLSESSSRFYLMVNLLLEESKKGWTWSGGIPSTIQAFYQTVLGFNSTFAAKIRERSFLNELIIHIMKGTLAAHDGLNTIIRHYDFPLPVLNDYQGISILSGTALSVFAENNPLEAYGDKDFGSIALELTIVSTGLVDACNVAAPDTLVSSIPLANLYGQICDKYTKIANEAYLIDTIGKGEWPMHLRTLALPMSDKVFSERASHTITRVGALLGDRIKASLSQLRASDF